MKYFQAYLTDAVSLEEIDISVHCDVHIFQWLMTYVKNPDSPNAPNFDITNVVSILISSEFLQMEKLVQESLAYVRAHAVAVVRSPVDLNCLSANLMRRLAAMFTPLDIDTIKDKRDKLVSRLYMHKTEELLSIEENNLHQCVNCKYLFTASQHHWHSCSKSSAYVTFHGALMGFHVPERFLDIKKLLIDLRVKGHPWRSIYWKLWALCNDLQCSSCRQRFQLSSVDRCVYHPEEATFSSGLNLGTFPCCRASAMRFSPASVGSLEFTLGCMSRRHEPDIRTAEQRQLCTTLSLKLDAILPSLQSLVGDKLQLTTRKRPDSGSDQVFSPVPASYNHSESALELRQRFTGLSKIPHVSLWPGENSSDSSDFETGAESDGNESGEDAEAAATRRSSSKHSNQSGFGVRVGSKGKPMGLVRPDSASSDSRRVAEPPFEQGTMGGGGNAHGSYKLDHLRQDDRARMNAIIEQLTAQRPSTRSGGKVKVKVAEKERLSI
jgi:hypothetical protein